MFAGHGAGEFLHQLALVDNLDGWNALHAKSRSQLLVFVYVDFGQCNARSERGDDFFYDGAQRLAGSAPRSPEIDNDNALFGAADNEFFEIALVGIEDLRLGFNFHDSPR